MQNLRVNEYTYCKIYIKDKNTLVKYSILPCDAWYNLQKKNLDFINTPTNVYSLNKEEKHKYRMCKSKIEIPWLRRYHILYDCKFLDNLTTKELLKLLRKNLLLLKKLHENDIVHSDIYEKNIMVNKRLDINFIDFDNSIIDNYISPNNPLYNDKLKLSQKKEKCIKYDKQDLITTYLSYISQWNLHLNFFDEDSQKILMKQLLLPTTIYKELCHYLTNESIIPKDYYFLDIINELITCNYESPLIKCKR